MFLATVSCCMHARPASIESEVDGLAAVTQKPKARGLAHVIGVESVPIVLGQTRAGTHTHTHTLLRACLKNIGKHATSNQSPCRPGVRGADCSKGGRICRNGLLRGSSKGQPLQTRQCRAQKASARAEPGRELPGHAPPHEKPWLACNMQMLRCKNDFMNPPTHTSKSDAPKIFTWRSSRSARSSRSCESWQTQRNFRIQDWSSIPTSGQDVMLDKV